MTHYKNQQNEIVPNTNMFLTKTKTKTKTKTETKNKKSLTYSKMGTQHNQDIHET